MEAKFVGDFGGVHGVREILLVGKDKEEGIAEFVFVQHPLQFFAGFGDTFPIIGVDDENDALGVLEVCKRQFSAIAGVSHGNGTRTMPPERTDLVLTTNVPDGE